MHQKSICLPPLQTRRGEGLERMGAAYLKLYHIAAPVIHAKRRRCTCSYGSEVVFPRLNTPLSNVGTMYVRWRVLDLVLLLCNETFNIL